MAVPGIVEDLEARIRSALELVNAAERSLRAGQSGVASACYGMADDTHASVLGGISRLSEAEADLLEPSFTSLEEKLLRAGSWAPRTRWCGWN